MKRPLTLEGKLFGLRIPQHANLGCLAMLVGSIFAFWLSAAFGVLLQRADSGSEGRDCFLAILVAASFVTGILVGIICKERRGLYALLTALFYPVLLPPPMLLGYYLMGLMDGQIVHPFLIPIALCPVAAYLGAKAWEKLRASMRKPEKV